MELWLREQWIRVAFAGKNGEISSLLRLDTPSRSSIRGTVRPSMTKATGESFRMRVDYVIQHRGFRHVNFQYTRSLVPDAEYD